MRCVVVFKMVGTGKVGALLGPAWRMTTAIVFLLDPVDLMGDGAREME